MELKVAETLTVAGYSTSALGAGTATFSTELEAFIRLGLYVLSAIGVCSTMYFQWRHHVRQERKMLDKERGDENC